MPVEIRPIADYQVPGGQRDFDFYDIATEVPDDIKTALGWRRAGRSVTTNQRAMPTAMVRSNIGRFVDPVPGDARWMSAAALYSLEQTRPGPPPVPHVRQPAPRVIHQYAPRAVRHAPPDHTAMVLDILAGFRLPKSMASIGARRSGKESLDAL
jgi:hypothetical protein